jgi:hypothetical protein
MSVRAANNARLRTRFSLWALAWMLAGCATPIAPETAEPGWLTRRPSDPAFFYGVGQCGPTYYSQEALQIAIVRAATEIHRQSQGLSDDDVRYVGEADDGSVSVVVERDGREIGRLEGLVIVERVQLSRGRSGRADGSIAVLLRWPRHGLGV